MISKGPRMPGRVQTVSLTCSLLMGLAPAGAAFANVGPKTAIAATKQEHHSGKVDKSFRRVKIGLTDGVSSGASVTLNSDNNLTLIANAGAWRDLGTSAQVLRIGTNGGLLDADFEVPPEMAETIKLAEQTGLGSPWHAQPDGSVLIMTPVALMRLTSTGAVDAGFTSPALGKGDVFLGLASANAGRFWVMTLASTGGETLMRINGDGSIDESFAPFKVRGVGGYPITGTGYDDALAYDGRVLRRIRVDGSIDPSFSYKRQNLGVERLPGGRTLLEWNKDPRRVSHLAVLKPNGSVDRSFRFRNPDKLWVNKIIAQGRNLVVQGSEAGVRPRLFRIRANGSVDRTFHAPRMWVDDWAIQSDGRIVVAGRDAENPKTKPGFVIRLL